MDIGRLFDIRGKRAVVTGGSTGIGWAIATGLAAAGATVLICSRKQASIDEALARHDGPNITGVVADVSREEGVADLVAAVGDRPLNILINNAGANWAAPLERFPRSGFEKVLSLNLLAPFAVASALLPALRRAATSEDPARIINIGSIDAIRLPVLETYPYSASKAGLVHMSRHMARQLAPENIAVNLISPGIFPSKMTNSAFDLDDPEVIASRSSPLGRRFGTPEDIAGAAIYLSARAGAWLTGVDIVVSGGAGIVDG